MDKLSTTTKVIMVMAGSMLVVSVSLYFGLSWLTIIASMVVCLSGIWLSPLMVLKNKNIWKPILGKDVKTEFEVRLRKVLRVLIGVFCLLVGLSVINLHFWDSKAERFERRKYEIYDKMLLEYDEYEAGKGDHRWGYFVTHDKENIPLMLELLAYAKNQNYKRLIVANLEELTELDFAVKGAVSKDKEQEIVKAVKEWQDKQ